MKYHKDISTQSSYVYYLFYGKDDNVVTPTPSKSCFADITGNDFRHDWYYIKISTSKDHVPFDSDIVHRWIADLNELGFPCWLEEDKDSYLTTVRFKDKQGNFIYNTKLHLFTGLMFIRYFWHINISPIVSYYFEILESVPEADKFLAIQLAHAYLKNPKGSYYEYPNRNHMIRDMEYREFISHKEFWEICEKKPYLLENQRFSMSSTWLRPTILGGLPSDYLKAYNLAFENSFNKQLV